MNSLWWTPIKTCCLAWSFVLSVWSQYLWITHWIATNNFQHSTRFVKSRAQDALLSFEIFVTWPASSLPWEMLSLSPWKGLPIGLSSQTILWLRASPPTSIRIIPMLITASRQPNIQSWLFYRRTSLSSSIASPTSTSSLLSSWIGCRRSALLAKRSPWFQWFLCCLWLRLKMPLKTIGDIDRILELIIWKPRFILGELGIVFTGSTQSISMYMFKWMCHAGALFSCDVYIYIKPCDIYECMYWFSDEYAVFMHHWMDYIKMWFISSNSSPLSLDIFPVSVIETPKLLQTVHLSFKMLMH